MALIRRSRKSNQNGSDNVARRNVPSSKLLNVGCGPHYVPGWTNTDLVANDLIKPDFTVSTDNPFPFRDSSFERAYVGHVVEHVPWHLLPQWMSELSRVLQPGSAVAFIGPDANAAIECYRTGAASRDQVDGIIEALDPYQAGFERWNEDRHHWNCSGPRIAYLLSELNWGEVQDLTPTPGELLPELPGWPVVSHAPLQCAVLATSPMR